MRMTRCPALRINWDIVNGWRASELPWGNSVFSHIKGYVSQVHVKGARANLDGSYRSMAQPGLDDVPHENLFSMLHESGFCGTVTIDPHYDQFDEKDRVHSHSPVLDVAKSSRAFLLRIIERIKTQ